MRNHNYYVYMMASQSGVLYIGVTNNLERRVWEHKNNFIKGFTEKYKCHKLVYYEHFSEIKYAIAREKQLKKWRRDKKENLINKLNLSRRDLSAEWNKLKDSSTPAKFL